MDDPAETTSLRKTPLCGWHEAHAGRMVDFAGWRMPVLYTSIVEEHLATRTVAGLFDVSHMGRLAVTGPGAADWLETSLTRRVADLERGRARYTLVTSDADGLTILDDALVAREADDAAGAAIFTLVVNAGNRAAVVAWLESRLPAAGVSLVDRTADTAMIAVQGPRAVEIVSGLCEPAEAVRISGLGAYRTLTARVAGVPAAVSRTGYTGEDGLEIVVPAAAAVTTWETIHAAGAPRGLRACGLGARDTLRLEAGMPLFGQELVGGSDPFAIGLGLAVNLEDAAGRPRCFPGASRLRTLAAEPPARLRVGLVGDGRRIPREHCPVLHAGRQVGTVTSGSFAPSLGRAVAMALVDRGVSTLGTALEVLVRDSPQAVSVVPLPFHRRPAARV